MDASIVIGVLSFIGGFGVGSISTLLWLGRDRKDDLEVHLANRNTAEWRDIVEGKYDLPEKHPYVENTNTPLKKEEFFDITKEAIHEKTEQQPVKTEENNLKLTIKPKKTRKPRKNNNIK